RLLLIEEDLTTLARLERALREGGFEVRALADPRAALLVTQAFSPALVLVQRQLKKGLGGFEVARALQSSAHAAATPIAFLTSDASWAELIRIVRAGGADVLPTRPDDAWLERVSALAASGASTAVPTRAERLALIVERNQATGSIHLNAGTPFE